jgi:flavin-dependent dehydrogenase
VEAAVVIAATLTLHEAARTVWDAVVVGAGPAGSLAARELARRGRSVLLVDRAAFPRKKVCGCCLNGSALATLRQVGLGDLTARCGAVQLRWMQLAAGSRSARLPLAEGVALSRETFDAALVSAAIAAGVAFLPQTKAQLAFLKAASERGMLSRPTRSLSNGQGREGPRKHGTLRDVTLGNGEKSVGTVARVILAADGLGGTFLARAGENEARPAAGARIGAGVVTADVPPFYHPGTIYMACGRRGYLGLVRLEDGRLDLAAALDAAWLRDTGSLAAAAADLLTAVRWPLPAGLAEQHWRGTPPLTRRVSRVACDHVFALGDAAGYVEPFTGEGMAWALAAAEAVAPIAARGWQSSSERAWEGAFGRVVRRRQLTCRLAAAVLRRPWLTRALIALLSRLPHLARPIVYHLNSRTKRPVAFTV